MRNAFLLGVFGVRPAAAAAGDRDAWPPPCGVRGSGTLLRSDRAQRRAARRRSRTVTHARLPRRTRPRLLQLKTSGRHGNRYLFTDHEDGQLRRLGCEPTQR